MIITLYLKIRRPGKPSFICSFRNVLTFYVRLHLHISQCMLLLVFIIHLFHIMYVHLGVRLTVDGPNEGVHPRPSKLHY